MKNKRYWLAGLAISIGAIAFYNFNTFPDAIATSTIDTDSAPKDLTVNQTDMTSITLSPTLPSSAQSSSQKESKTYARLQDRLDAMRERRPNLQFDPAAVAAAVNRQQTWENAKKLPSHLPLKPEEFTDGRQFIQLDSLKIETLMPGDAVKVSIVDSGERDYNVIMDSIEKHDYNSISWHGHIDGDDGQTYQVSFTRGEKLTLGGLDTPEGHYVLQAHGNDGWIASSKLLFKIDPNHTDEVYPTEDNLHP